MGLDVGIIVLLRSFGTNYWWEIGEVKEENLEGQRREGKGVSELRFQVKKCTSISCPKVSPSSPVAQNAQN
jgi:hypothetical protein